MRSQSEIDIQINRLERLRRRLPETTIFGDNNHLLIDTQIEILKGEINEDDVYDNEEEHGDNISTLTDTLQWLEGEDIQLVEDDDLKKDIIDGTTDEPCTTPKGKQCKECPFRKSSLAGYLGEASYNPHEFLSTTENDPIPCHMAVDWEKEDGIDKQYKTPCIGSLKFLKNTMRIPRNPEYAKLLKGITKDETVFEKKADFINHHSKS